MFSASFSDENLAGTRIVKSRSLVPYSYIYRLQSYQLSPPPQISTFAHINPFPTYSNLSTRPNSLSSTFHLHTSPQKTLLSPFSPSRMNTDGLRKGGLLISGLLLLLIMCNKRQQKKNREERDRMSEYEQSYYSDDDDSRFSR